MDRERNESLQMQIGVTKKRELERGIKRDLEEVLLEAGKSLCHLLNPHNDWMSLSPFYGRGGRG